MRKIDIPDGTTTRYFEPEEIICMQADREYTHIYHVEPTAKCGYKKITAAYCLKHFEEKVWCLPFMRVHDSWVVDLKHVKALAKNNIITLSFNCCEGVELEPKLRKLFQDRLKIVQAA